MRQVDLFSHLTLGMGFAFLLAGGFVAGLGVLFVLAIAWAYLAFSGTGMTPEIAIGTASSAMTCTIPGLLVSAPGMIFVGAVLWGRLRSRWNQVLWEEFREPEDPPA